MLPQGQFQRLLVASSDERQAILEALFDVATFARIESALKESAAEARRGIDDARRGREEVLRAAGAASGEELAGRRREADAELTAARAADAGLRLARSSAQWRWRRPAGWRRSCASGRRRRRRCNSSKSGGRSSSDKEAVRSRAGKAAELAGAEASLRQRQLEAAGATRRLAAARGSAEAADGAKAKADADLSAEARPRAAARGGPAARGPAGGNGGQGAAARPGAGVVRMSAELLGRQTAERDAAAALLEKVRRQVAAAGRDVEGLSAEQSKLPLLQSAVREAGQALKGRERLEAARKDRSAAESASEESPPEGGELRAGGGPRPRSAAPPGAGVARRAGGGPGPPALAPAPPAPSAARPTTPAPAKAAPTSPPRKPSTTSASALEAWESPAAEMRDEAADAEKRLHESAGAARLYEEQSGDLASQDLAVARERSAKAEAELSAAGVGGHRAGKAEGFAGPVEDSRRRWPPTASRRRRRRRPTPRPSWKPPAPSRPSGRRASPRRSATSPAWIASCRAARRRLKAMDEALAQARQGATDAAAGAAAAGAAPDGRRASRRGGGAVVAGVRRRVRSEADRVVASRTPRRSPPPSCRPRRPKRWSGRSAGIASIYKAARERLMRAEGAAQGLTEPDLAALQSAAESAEAGAGAARPPGRGA